MPNWCENDLEISGGGGVLACLEAIKGEPEQDPPQDEKNPSPIDFNKIVPMPKSLDITSGGNGDMGYAAWHGTDEELAKYLGYPWAVKDGLTTREKFQAWLLEKRPDVKPLGDQYAQNLAEHGAKTWYEWRVTHWGTKWPARRAHLDGGEVADDRTCLHFDTAWSPPKPVILALGKKFPALRFEMRYFECGVGYNGLYVVEDGEEARDESGDYFGDRGG